MGALGRRFESCRPDSVIPTALGIPGSPFFCSNWPMYEKCTNGLACWTPGALRLALVREMYESPLPTSVRVLQGGIWPHRQAGISLSASSCSTERPRPRRALSVRLQQVGRASCGLAHRRVATFNVIQHWRIWGGKLSAPMEPRLKKAGFTPAAQGSLADLQEQPDGSGVKPLSCCQWPC